MKLYYASAESGTPDLAEFLGTLEPKLRIKLIHQFHQLMTQPLPVEPTVKHFSIERYSALYELRARSQVMVRIVFTIRDDGNILFLVPFVKKHTRNTMQALNGSLKILKQAQLGECRVEEMTVEWILKEIGNAKLT